MKNAINKGKKIFKKGTGSRGFEGREWTPQTRRVGKTKAGAGRRKKATGTNRKDWNWNSGIRVTKNRT